MIKKHIPNSITLLNLFCGCCAVVCVLSGAYLLAALFIGLGLLADFLDGAVARLLGVSSEIGKQLDSLADVVSFGVAPGAMLYQLLLGAQPNADALLPMAALPGFVLSVFAGLRLAKFNIDTRQSTDFIGLPTPACTLFVVGLLLIAHFDSFGLRAVVTHPAVLYGCIVILSGLMISELPMFSFKFAHFTWQGNQIKFIFAAIAVILLLALREAALSLIIIIYIVFSIVQYLNKHEIRS